MRDGAARRRSESNAVLLQAQSAASAVSGVDALVAQRAAVEADIALTKLHLEMLTVRAPFDGRIISLKTSVGDLLLPCALFFLIDTIVTGRDSQLPRNQSEKYRSVHPNDSPDE